LGIRKSIQPVKLSDEVLVLLSVWSKVQIATAIPKLHHLLPYLNPDWFTFLILAYPGRPGREAIKQV